MQQQTAKTTTFYDPCRAVVENALQDISTMTQIRRWLTSLIKTKWREEDKSNEVIMKDKTYWMSLAA